MFFGETNAVNFSLNIHFFVLFFNQIIHLLNGFLVPLSLTVSQKYYAKLSAVNRILVKSFFYVIQTRKKIGPTMSNFVFHPFQILIFIVCHTWVNIGLKKDWVNHFKAVFFNFSTFWENGVSDIDATFL